MDSYSFEIDKVLPVDVFIVSGSRFSEKEVSRFVSRTDRKIQKVGIKIEIKSFSVIEQKKLAFVNDENVEALLKNYGSPQRLRLFFIREYSDPSYDSWTYDPLIGGDVNSDIHWRGAVFISDAWADFDENMYLFRGFPKSSDTLLHELGHVLMQEDQHLKKTKVPNFFNDNALYCDDTISVAQGRKMRLSSYLVDAVSKVSNLSQVSK